MKYRPIAFYLPQFHPFAENDDWWGKGFTEWSNVVKAKPLFKGHHQPHLPTELGFYDLRLPQAREEQAALAKAYGIYGFCYYHYWFNGKRLMHEPLDYMLQSGKPDFPFMYCWANENWTRRWDGDEDKVLIKQDYSEADDQEHIRYLCKHVFSDPRYIRVDGKPFFAVYRPGLFPDIQHSLRTWRREAMAAGIGELYIGYVQAFNLKVAPDTLGFDAAIDFQPDFHNTPEVLRSNGIGRALNRLKMKPAVWEENTVIEYASYAALAMSRPNVGYKQFPGVSPGWDNTARRKTGAFILKDSTPEWYEKWLTRELEKFRPYSSDENFIFINAWNEWAEGNHLEPCTKWGRAYLEATKKAVDHASR